MLHTQISSDLVTASILASPDDLGGIEQGQGVVVLPVEQIDDPG